MSTHHLWRTRAGLRRMRLHICADAPDICDARGHHRCTDCEAIDLIPDWCSYCAGTCQSTVPNDPLSHGMYT
jgi:hypothetical protein